MTIEFYKSKKQAKSLARAIRAVVKRKGIRAVKVKIDNVSLLSDAGGRKYTPKGRVSHKFSQGETGYIIGFRGMKKAGLRRVR
jgi:hypothetical protein